MASSPELSPVLGDAAASVQQSPRILPITTERVARTIQTLSYAEMASVRNNLSLYERAPNYTMEEKRSVRMTITTRNNEDVAIQTKLTSVLDMFSIGSHKHYNMHVGGIRQIGFNLYEINVKSELSKITLIEKFANASTARGTNSEDIF